MAGRSATAVTFLLTDIEGSTRLLAAAGPTYPRLVAEQRTLIAAAVTRAGGTAQPFEGDGCLAVFPDATAAVVAAIDAQHRLAAHHWPAHLTVRVRMGVHTGEALLQDGEHFGLALHRAARIADAAHGGQILVSDVTRRALDRLPDGAGLADLGAHRLKDLEAPIHLHQLLADGLADEFPPLRTLRDTRHNLPEQSSTLVGRDDDVAAVTGMLRDHRLVTVTGMGGVGKTRLAVHVGARNSDAFPDGVWLVELARTRRPDAVADLIAEQVGVDSAAPADAVADVLRERAALLILDNFEHVMDAAPVVRTILAGAPRVRVLATSRERLLIDGEHTYPLAPLPLTGGEGTAAGTPGAAVALFLDRARAHDPAFDPTADDIDAIRAICELVDGLPLAIELAAAQTRLLPVAGVRDRLRDGLVALSGRARDRPERHRTLRATLAWSYDLLPTDEQRLLARLAVFDGGRSVEAVAAVCDADIDIIDGLTALVDKSLVQRRIGPDGDVRFMLPEVVHAYARERLEASGQADAVRAAQATYLAELAEGADDGLLGEDAQHWEDRVNEQLGNIRGALRWAFDGGDTAVGVRITAGLFLYWRWGGAYGEGREWIDRALAEPELLDRATRGRLRAARGYEVIDADPVGSRPLWLAALADLRASGDQSRTVHVLGMLSMTYAGDVEHYPMAKRWTDEAVGIARGVRGNRRLLGDALAAHGELARAVGHLARAAASYEEGIAVMRPTGDERYTAILQMNLAAVTRRQGDPQSALQLATEALATMAKLPRRDLAAYSLAEVAGHEHGVGRPERAARLLGAGDSALRRLHVPRQAADRLEYEQVRRELTAELGTERFAELERDGAALSLDEAIDLALSPTE